MLPFIIKAIFKLFYIAMVAFCLYLLIRIAGTLGVLPWPIA